METLQLKEIAGYLPYRLRVEFNRKMYPRKIEVKELTLPDLHLIETSPDKFSCKPLLRPMSDFINPLPDGTIPIIQMAKLVNDDPEGSDPNNWYEWDKVRLATSGVFGDVYSVFSRHDEMIFRINTKNMYMDMSEDGEYVTACPYTDKLFDYLHEHMFDYRGLIQRGLAIDLNSVKEK